MHKKTKELNESQHELKSTMQKLEDAITQSKIDHDKITQCNEEIKHYKRLIDNEKENYKVKDHSSQISAELQEKNKENLALQERECVLQSAVQEMEDALRQSKSEQDIIMTKYIKEIEHYKNISGTEKEKSVKLQENLAKTSAELQEKTKETVELKEREYGLQSTVHNLKDALRQSKSEHDKIITQYIEEIQHYKNINDVEKVNGVNVQEKLAQISAELQDKAKETLALKESQHELKFTIQKLEDALRQSKCDHDKIITEYITEIEHCKNLNDTEKDNTVKVQDALAQVTAELHIKTKETLALKESQHELQSALKQSKSDHNEMITQYTKEIRHYKDIYDAEKLNSVKMRENLAQVSDELQDKAKEILSLKETQLQLQSTIEKLEDTLRQSKIEHAKKITEFNKEMEHYRNLNDAEKVNSVKEQEKLAQISAELQDKAKEILVLKESQHELKSTVQKLEDALRQSKSDHDKIITEYITEIEHCKNLNDIEKDNTVKVQDTLAQVTAKLQEKTKETLTLKVSQHELQSALKQSKSDHNEMITQHTEEIQHYKNMHDAEKLNSVKVQEDLAQILDELQDKAKEILALKETQLQLQSTIQKLEDALRQSKIEHDKKITEYTKQIQHYKTLSDAEKDNTVKVQDALAQVTAELQEKTKETLTLKKSQHELQSALKQSKSDHNERIAQHTEEIQHYKNINDTEKLNSVKVQENLVRVSAELLDKTKETVALKENQLQLQSTIQKLEDALRQSKIEHDKKITDYIKEIEHYKNLNDTEKENAAKVQDALVQVSTELQEKATAFMEREYKLQSTIQKLEDSLRQFKSEYDPKIEHTKEIEHYKYLCDAEKENTIIAQDTLAQVSSELQVKTKENSALKEREYELQSKVRKLEDSLQKSKNDHNRTIAKYAKEIQYYRNQSNVEKEGKSKVKQDFERVLQELNEKEAEILAVTKTKCELQSKIRKLEDALKQYTSKHDTKQIEYEAETETVVNLQDNIAQLKAELHKKSKETLEFKENQHALQSTIQKLEDDLRQSNSEHDKKSEDYTKQIEYYKNLIEIEKESTIKAKDTLAQVSAELQKQTNENLTLKYEFQSSVQKLKDTLEQSKSESDKEVEEYVKEIYHYKNLSEAEKENTVKVQDTLAQVSAELQEKSRETLALKEQQCELQSAVQELEDAKRQSESKLANAITEYTKQIQYCEILIDFEKETTMKLKAELEERTKELQETQLKLQETELKLQETKIKLQETQLKLQETELKLQETEIKLQETELKLQETEIKLQETQLKLQETQLKLQDALKGECVSIKQKVSSNLEISFHQEESVGN